MTTKKKCLLRDRYLWYVRAQDAEILTLFDSRFGHIGAGARFAMSHATEAVEFFSGGRSLRARTQRFAPIEFRKRVAWLETRAKLSQSAAIGSSDQRIALGFASFTPHEPTSLVELAFR